LCLRSYPLLEIRRLPAIRPFTQNSVHPLFDRYYRSESTKQQSGAGLGLWLAQSMANAQNLIERPIQFTVSSLVNRLSICMIKAI